jgi:hypothetical protein
LRPQRRREIAGTSVPQRALRAQTRRTAAGNRLSAKQKERCVRLDKLTIDSTLPIAIDLSRRSYCCVGSNPTICLIKFQGMRIRRRFENQITIRAADERYAARIASLARWIFSRAATSCRPP